MTRVRFWSLAWLACAVQALVAVLVWYWLVPVAWVWPVGPLSYENGIVSGRFAGYKFKDCARIPGRETGFFVSRSTGPDVAHGFEFYKDKSPNSSRVPGAHDFGVWRWYVDSPPASVSMSMQHFCGGATPVQTSFGPFDVAG